ncbi:MAG: winged helix-turn-helix domain-containing protein [Bryobacteraceae bacterium]
MSTPIRFEDFELDVSAYELRRAGEAVKLERIPMELLMFLAANPGRLVLRSELVDRIWGKNHFLQDETAINTAVRKLRAALADNAEKPRFIETVTGKGYRFTAAIRDALSKPGETALAAPHRTILVVLPLENLSEPPRESYLNDGLTEELITCLGALAPAQLGIIGRTSAMECQRRGLTVREIGRELGADLVLEGSVRRQLQRVRISVRLLQVSDQAQMWAKSYEQDLDDLLAWQCDVAREIVREVTSAASLDSLAPPARKRRVNLQAYECYLKGRHLWNKKTPRAYHEAISLFQQAIDHDPAYALPFVGLADTWILMAIHGLAPSSETYPRARAAAGRALELDATLAEAHTALADVSKGYDWNWVEAEAGYREALRLNSNYAVAHQWYANLLSILNRHSEAIAEAEEARRLDPLAASIAGFVGFTYYRARRYDEAAREVEKAMEMGPRLPIVNWFLGQIYTQRRQFDRAVEVLSGAAAESHGGAIYVAMLGHAYGRAGDRAAALDTLKQLDSLARDRYVSPLDFSIVHAGLGDVDTTLAWLERAIDERVMRVTELQTPTFDALRHEPRFQQLAARAGLAGRCPAAS